VEHWVEMGLHRRVILVGRSDQSCGYRSLETTIAVPSLCAWSYDHTLKWSDMHDAEEGTSRDTFAHEKMGTSEWVVNITFWHYPGSRAGYKPVNPRHQVPTPCSNTRKKKERNSSELK
jgi:hypothetical protein